MVAIQGMAAAGNALVYTEALLVGWWLTESRLRLGRRWTSATGAQRPQIPVKPGAPTSGFFSCLRDLLLTLGRENHHRTSCWRAIKRIKTCDADNMPKNRYLRFEVSRT